MGLNEAVIDRLGLSSVETCSMPRQSAAHDAKVSGGLETWMEDDHILCVQAGHNMYGVQPETLLSEMSALLLACASSKEGRCGETALFGIVLDGATASPKK